MLRAINTWDDYRAKLREFDAVLEHGKAVSAALDGQPLSSSHASYGEQIFAKLLCHCTVLRSLAPDPNHGAPRELWDVSTMSAVACCVVEAHDAFEYIAGHDVTDSERAFRIMLWELHDQSRRLKMLVASGSELRRVETIRADALRLQAALERHDFFHNLPAHLQAELQRRMTKGDTPAFHLNPRRRCAMSGVNADWYNAITIHLSQYVHTLPFSVHELFQCKAGTPDALRLMGLPVVYATPFLVRVTQAVVRLMPVKAPAPPSRTARTMLAWQMLAERGTHGIA